jgi:hypothetical protein
LHRNGNDKSKEGNTDSLPPLNLVDIDSDLAKEPSTQIDHFFVYANADPDMEDETVGLDL